MKKKLNSLKPKLSLDKNVIARLSQQEQRAIYAGNNESRGSGTVLTHWPPFAGFSVCTHWPTTA